MGKRTERNAKLRLYDSTATPWYLELDFDSEYSGPIGIPRQEEILVLNRGTMDALAHYVKGPDDKMMEPVDVAFKVLIRSETQTVNLIAWLMAMNDAAATQVNSHTLQTTKGDTQRDGATNNPAFADTNKICCNVEYLIEMGTPDLGFKLAEVWIPTAEISLAESADAIELPIKGKCYGTITKITAFTSGTDVEA